MSRVNAFLVVLLAVSSVSFGATLMHRSIISIAHNYSKPSETSCQELIRQQEPSFNHFIAEQLYKEAFKASFNGQWQKADQASQCAALMEHGTKHWSYEASDLIGGY